MIAEARAYWQAVDEARRWAKRTHQPLLPMLTRAVERYLEYEAQPHCTYCDGTEFDYYEGDVGTGVFAPDGGEERHYERWVKCRRCGSCEHTSDLVRRG